MKKFYKPLTILVLLMGFAYGENETKCESYLDNKTFSEYIKSDKFILPKLKNGDSKVICLKKDGTKIMYDNSGESIINPNNDFMTVNKSYKNGKLYKFDIDISHFPYMHIENGKDGLSVSRLDCWKYKTSPMQIMENLAKMGEVDLKNERSGSGGDLNFIQISNWNSHKLM